LIEHSDIFEASVTKDEISGQRSMFLVPKIAEAFQIDIKCSRNWQLLAIVKMIHLLM